jgi:hypothetical protein
VLAGNGPAIEVRGLASASVSSRLRDILLSADGDVIAITDPSPAPE